jgi:hypothetical protein
MDGSTDYIELWGYQDSGGTLGIAPNFFATYFNASMVRGA